MEQWVILNIPDKQYTNFTSFLKLLSVNYNKQFDPNNCNPNFGKAKFISQIEAVKISCFVYICKIS